MSSTSSVIALALASASCFNLAALSAARWAAVWALLLERCAALAAACRAAALRLSLSLLAACFSASKDGRPSSLSRNSTFA